MLLCLLHSGKGRAIYAWMCWAACVCSGCCGSDSHLNAGCFWLVFGRDEL